MYPLAQARLALYSIEKRYIFRGEERKGPSLHQGRTLLRGLKAFLVYKERV